MYTITIVYPLRQVDPWIFLFSVLKMDIHTPKTDLYSVQKSAYEYIKYYILCVQVIFSSVTVLDRSLTASESFAIQNITCSVVLIFYCFTIQNCRANLSPLEAKTLSLPLEQHQLEHDTQKRTTNFTINYFAKKYLKF